MCYAVGRLFGRSLYFVVLYVCLMLDTLFCASVGGGRRRIEICRCIGYVVYIDVCVCVCLYPVRTETRAFHRRYREGGEMK